MRLNPDQVEAFDRAGILLIPDVFSPAELTVLERALAEVADPRRPGVVLDEGDTVRMAHGIHRDHPVFRALARHPRLVAPSRRLLDGEVYVYQSRLNLKAGLGRRPAAGYPWHQDFSTWHLRDGLPEPRAVVSFTFLDPVTACNAPLMVIPGSHRGGILGLSEVRSEEPFRQIHISPELLAEQAERGGVEALLAPAGSVAFMHCNLVHGSTENISPLRRALYSVVFCAADNRPGRFAMSERYVPRDATPVRPLADDCLLRPVVPRPGEAAEDE